MVKPLQTSGISGLQLPTMAMQAGTLPAQLNGGIDINAIMNMMLMMMVMVMMMKIMTKVGESV